MNISRSLPNSAIRISMHALGCVAICSAITIGTAENAVAASIVPTKNLPSPDSCLTLSWKESGFAWHNQKVIAKNNCSHTVGFDVVNGQVLAWETSPCIAVEPGKTAGWQWTKGRRYDHSESCTPS
jgi:hypothetical protein